jgi:hypothetical protein
LRESTLIEERHAIDKKNVGDGRVIIVGYWLADKGKVGLGWILGGTDKVKVI